MPQWITYDEVVAAARLAYDEGRLLAQHPFRDEHDELVYGYRVTDPSGRELRCAIGATLSGETLDLIEVRNVADRCVEYLLHEVLEAPKSDHEAIDNFQTLHDDWLCGVDFSREKFLNLIGREEDKSC